MSITAVINGSVVTKIKVDFKANNKLEVETEVTANPGVYSDKVFKLLDGSYLYVTPNDVVEDPESNLLTFSQIMGDTGVLNFPGKVFTVNITGNVTELDPAGTGSSDDVDLIIFTNSAGNGKQIKGLVPATKNKSIAYYNEGPDSVSLRDMNGGPPVESRFDIRSHLTLDEKEGVIGYYDMGDLKHKLFRI